MNTVIAQLARKGKRVGVVTAMLLAAAVAGTTAANAAAPTGGPSPSAQTEIVYHTNPHAPKGYPDPQSYDIVGGMHNLQIEIPDGMQSYALMEINGSRNYNLLSYRPAECHAIPLQHPDWIDTKVEIQNKLENFVRFYDAQDCIFIPGDHLLDLIFTPQHDTKQNYWLVSHR